MGVYRNTLGSMETTEAREKVKKLDAPLNDY
jgi:hypothetical protein